MDRICPIAMGKLGYSHVGWSKLQPITYYSSIIELVYFVKNTPHCLKSIVNGLLKLTNFSLISSPEIICF